MEQLDNETTRLCVLESKEEAYRSSSTHPLKETRSIERTQLIMREVQPMSRPKSVNVESFSG